MVENKKDKSPSPYRCKDTVDLEELIAMKTEKEKPTKATATITYASGREEILIGEINKNGIYDKVFREKLNQLKNFPTVQKIEIKKT